MINLCQDLRGNSGLRKVGGEDPEYQVDLKNPSVYCAHLETFIAPARMPHVFINPDIHECSSL